VRTKSTTISVPGGYLGHQCTKQLRGLEANTSLQTLLLLESKSFLPFKERDIGDMFTSDGYEPRN
jgi:hypothetical protein